MSTPKESQRAASITPIEALHEACARNAPLEIVESGKEGIEPFARGRMFEIEKGEIVVEQVQLIGKTKKFARGTPVIAYFRFHKELYEFRSRILTSELPVQLNKTVVVPAMHILLPSSVSSGQRRNVFRIPLAALKSPIHVEFWKEKPPANTEPRLQEGQTPRGDGVMCCADGGETESGEVLVPARRADWPATMIDASDVGLGINVQGCRLRDITRYEKCWVRFEIPGDDEGPVAFRVEVRQARSIREGLIRVGLYILETDNRIDHIAKIRRFWSFLTMWQRKVVRLADSA